MKPFYFSSSTLALVALGTMSLFAVGAEGESSAEAAARPEEKGPAAAADAKLKEFNIDCNGWDEGVPPDDLFVVEGTIKIVTKDGSKAIMIDPVPIVDATAQIGDSAAGTSIIQAKVLASKKGRSYPRFGVSVHGLSGHRLFVNCAKKQLELIKSDEVVASAPYTWTSDAWTQIKLEVVLGADGNWQISGKAWPGDGQEPTDPQIKHQEPKDKIKGNGKAAIWGTPFSELPIYIDEVKLKVATKS